MPSLSFFSSSFLLLQAITPLVFCAAIPGDEEAPNGLNPEAPPRGCDAYGCPDPTYYLQDPTLIPDKTDVFIINFARPGKYQDTPKPDVNKILTDYLSTSSPYLLNQLNVDKKSIPALVNEGVPLLVDAVLSITQSKNVADGGKALQKWSQKIEPKSPCGLFAAAAVPASLIAFDAVYFANNANGVPTTNDLDYFLQPAFGSFSHDNDVSVHYNAKFPDFFSQKRSTNVDRNVYVRLAESAAKYRASPSSAGNPEFKKLVLVLLRQFGQVKQWAAADWVDTAFGLGYLNEYCKAGFRFRENKYEKDAAKDVGAVDKLLDRQVGWAFFEVWTKLNLYNTLGLPKDRSYTATNAKYTATQIYSLKFEHGTLEIKNNGRCSRTVLTGKRSAWVGSGC